MRQRFRWYLRNLQAVWKHRAAFVRNKAMGLFALPNILDLSDAACRSSSPFISRQCSSTAIVILLSRLHTTRVRIPLAALLKLVAYFVTFRAH